MWDLEQEFDLLEFDLQGVKIWQYIRMDLVRIIGERTGLLGTPHTIKSSLVDRLLSLPRDLYYAWRFNPMTAARPVETVILDHERHQLVDGRNIDVYTQYLIDDLDKEGHDYVVLEKPHLRRHVKARSPRRYCFEALNLRNFVKRQFMTIRLSTSKREQIERIGRAVDERFGIDLDLPATFLYHLKRFKANHASFVKLLTKYRPRRFILVVSYGHGDLIKAAKDLGIETIELQHGVFTKYHLGYSFPGRTEPLDYFPDQFWVWSEFWKNLISLPLPDDNVVNYGFAHLEQSKAKYHNVKRDARQILILSQGSVGPKLAEQVYLHRKHLRDYKIVYKLHPGEYDRWSEYAFLRKLVKLPNVKLVTKVDLYHLMAESQYQIGVSSTALFEGIELGCKTVLMNLPGIEYMETLLESGRAIMLEEFIKSEDSPD